MADVNSSPTQQRKVGFPLGIGILLLTIVFVWWLLRPGHSSFSRAIGFGWLVVFLLLAFNGKGQDNVSKAAKESVVSTTSVSSPPKAAPQTAIQVPKTTPAQDKPAKPVSKWTYSEDTDKMRGTKTTYAMIESENALEFGFPYAGGNATLVLRKRATDGLNVVLEIKGQFTCNSFNDETVAVKFDSGSIERYGCSEPADGSTGVLFINGAGRFVAKLKKAKSVIIEAQFYQQGRQQMQFDVAGLEWK